MSLATYKKKRNFKETSEPLPVVEKKEGTRTFVIQRHKASRLHYDFRLEVNGVLKSWAVPKGPSLYPTDKRLAMMVEDHPLSYGSFKGIIPEGNYGAGIVEIWDNGTYEPEEIDNISDKAIGRNIKNGMLKFSLKGRKLKGSFALVRIRGADSKNWLLIKHRDKYATDDAYNSEDDTPVNSPINNFLRDQETTDQPAKKQASRKQASRKQASRKQASAKQASAKQLANKQTPTKQTPTKRTPTKQTRTKQPVTKQTATKQIPKRQASAKQPLTEQASSKQLSKKQPLTKLASTERASTKQRFSKQDGKTSQDVIPDKDKKVSSAKAGIAAAPKKSPSKKSPSKKSVREKSTAKRSSAAKSSAKLPDAGGRNLKKK